MMNQLRGNSVTVKRFWMVLVTILFMLTFPMTRLNAQSFFGSIVGTVTDSTGATLSGATVKITNLGTNEVKSQTTDSAGNYRVMSLVPANYKVDVEMNGFKHFMRQPVGVAVEATARVDVSLEVGTISETVQVTTEAPQLQTESGSLGAQVEGTRVTEMPLNGRNSMNLIALVPGVIPQGSTMGTLSLNNGQGTHTSAGSWGNYQIAGGIAGQSASYLDGVTINVLGNTPALITTQDAVQEFKVATNAVSAEFGRFSGGAVQMTTKSGSNQYHGSAYEYLRNKLFNANDFFSNAAGAARKKWNQNQFGVTASAPVVKDKLFGFFSWEHFSSRQGASSATGTATQAMQNGIVNGHIQDPTGTCTGITYDAVSNTSTIPQSCWDPTSKVMKALYPLPNANLPGGVNWYSVPTMANDANQYNGRADWVVSPNQRIFARYTWWGMSDSPVKVFNDAGGIKSANGVTKLDVAQGVIGDTYTLNQTSILDLRLGFMRFNNFAMPENGGHVDLASLLPNSPKFVALATQMTNAEYPVPHMFGGHGLNNLFPMDDTSVSHYNSTSFAAALTKIWGQHTFKVGTELRLMDRNALNPGLHPSGGFWFTPQYVGDEWAAFLLGYPSNGTITVASSVGAYDYIQGYYVTDTWAVNRKLTLNLGLRYDLPGGLSERKDKSTVLLPTAKDPYTGVTGTMALVKSSLYSGRTTQNQSYSQIAPRAGFAYRLNNSTVLRGGYGLTYLPNDLQGGADPNSSVVGAATTDFINYGAPCSSSKPCTWYSNPFPNGLNQPVGRSKPDFMKNYLGGVVSAPNPDSAYGYNQQWNLTLGRQFQGDVMLEIGYVGAKGTHLPSGVWGLNELSSKYYSQGAALNGADPSGKYSSLGQSLRPFAAYQNFSNSNQNMGASSYHSLQAKLEKRFHNGGIIGANYTWGKFISDTDTLNGGSDPHGTNGPSGGSGAVQDFNNPKGERSIISYDIPQRFVVNYVLNLPFGKGQKFGANASGVVNTVISGWSVNGIATYQNGTPAYLSVNSGNKLTSQFGGGTLRPNYIAGCNKTISGTAYDRYKSGKWFNTACFTAPGDYAFGNQPRVDGAIRAQGTHNYDFTMVKSTTLHDNVNLQFKAEFFNLFNRTQFAPPSWFVDQQFGATLMQLNQQRLVQFAMRLNF